ncbi:MAG: hypothetical protein ACTSW7_00710 [Candidatus Thorarchaeota archaeon]|nr:hypothetical protein [Thermoplasmatales archaeon]
MTASKDFSRLCPDVMQHNMHNGDNAVIRDEMRQGTVEETNHGYLVMKSYGKEEFLTSDSAARFIALNESQYPSEICEPKPQKNPRKKRIKKIKEFDAMEFAMKGDWI